MTDSAMAAILARTYFHTVTAYRPTSEDGESGAVKSVTRGDTSVTYAVSGGVSPALAGLAPWRRLGRVKEE